MKRMLNDLEEHNIKFDNNVILTLLDNTGKLWFCGIDCATALDYKQPKQAIINHVTNDDKIKLSNINIDEKIHKHPHTIFINEAGLYSIIMSSRQEKAIRFKKWVTSDVLPSIREFGYYKFKEKKEKETTKLMDEINVLKKELKKVKDDLKIEKYPEGALFYVVDYSEDNNEIYRIGISDDMKQRKNIYDTHMLHKRNVIITEEILRPVQLEMCVRSMLYEYRYKNKKDFFICSKEIIKKSINECKRSLDFTTQKGGSNIIKQYDNEIKEKNREIKKIKENIKVQTIIFDDFKKKIIELK